MTKNTDAPVHFRVPFYTHAICGAYLRRNVQASSYAENATCPRCLVEIAKPATTVAAALDRVRVHVDARKTDVALVHRVLDRLNAIVDDELAAAGVLT